MLRPRARLRLGYTLVELLVIVAVLTLFTGMLLSFLGERSSSPRTQCINQQHQLSLAVIRFEFDKQRYPGWAMNMNPNPQGFGGRATGWVFPLIPYLDRGDLYSHYATQPPGDARAPQPQEAIKLLWCPSHDHGYDASSSYVVNTGYFHDAAPYTQRQEHPSVGVFTYQYRATAGDQPVKLSAQDITDGLAMTLMLTENLDGGNWMGRERMGDATNDVAEGCVGFAWAGRTPIPRLNAQAGLAKDCTSTRVGAGGALPRPSSNHGGGVVAAFCDGHVGFLDDDIDQRVFEGLCTPQSRIVDFWGNPTAPQRALPEVVY